MTCNTIQNHAIPFNTMEYHTIQHHALPYDTIRYNATPSTMQYNTFPSEVRITKNSKKPAWNSS